MQLNRPSADSSEPLHAAVKWLRSIHEPWFQLAKEGVMLLDLVPDTFVQEEQAWDAPSSHQRHRSKLMRAMDEVDSRFGRRTVLLVSSGITESSDT